MHVRASKSIFKLEHVSDSWKVYPNVMAPDQKVGGLSMCYGWYVSISISINFTSTLTALQQISWTTWLVNSYVNSHQQLHNKS